MYFFANFPIESMLVCSDLPMTKTILRYRLASVTPCQTLNIYPMRMKNHELVLE